MPRTAMLSIRMPGKTLEQLEATAEARGETRSALTQRYIAEGLRMDRHPGIVFRPGPSGRRPGLAGGLDVWEVVRVIRNVEPRGDQAIPEAAGWLSLSVTQVRIAMDYYADYPAEIDAWLAKVDAQAAEAEETAPKGRRHVAWGASPRKGREKDIQAPKGRRHPAAR